MVRLLGEQRKPSFDEYKKGLGQMLPRIGQHFAPDDSSLNQLQTSAPKFFRQSVEPRLQGFGISKALGYHVVCRQHCQCLAKL
jgi:hypothetical protein